MGKAEVQCANCLEEVEVPTVFHRPLRGDARGEFLPREGEDCPNCGLPWSYVEETCRWGAVAKGDWISSDGKSNWQRVTHTERVGTYYHVLTNDIRGIRITWLQLPGYTIPVRRASPERCPGCGRFEREGHETGCPEQ